MEHVEATFGVLGQDLQWLVSSAFVAGFLLMAPAPVAARLAAIRAESTELMELAEATFCAWLSGLLVAIGLLPMIGGLMGLLASAGASNYLSCSLLTVVFLVAFGICVVTQCRASMAYFRWLDDPPLRVKLRFVFSLRGLIVCQFIGLIMLGAWLGLRRQQIEERIHGFADPESVRALRIK